jgi:hypothetical protein
MLLLNSVVFGMSMILFLVLTGKGLYEDLHLELLLSR